MSKWYKIPYESADLAAMLDRFFTPDETEARKNMVELLDAYDDEIKIPGNMKQYYDQLFQVYKDTGLADDDMRGDMFTGTHSPQNLLEEIEKLCRILDNRELFSMDNLDMLNEKTLPLLEIGDALESKKGFSKEQVQDIQQYLIFLSDDSVDAFYQKREERELLTNPVRNVETALGNSAKNAGQLYNGLHKGEFHAADYVKSRVDMLQQFVNSDYDSLSEFFPLYDPKTYDPAKQPNLEELEARNKQKEAEAKHAAFLETGKQRDEMQVKAVKSYGAVGASVTAAENLLQQIEASRKEMMKPEDRAHFAEDMAQKQHRWDQEMQSSINIPQGYNKTVRSSNDLLRHMDDMIRAYPNADTTELQQKRAAFVERMEQLTTAPQLPKLDVEAMQEYDTNVQQFDTVTAEASQKLQNRITEVKNELAALKKDQEEILKKQEALSKADFYGNMDQLQAEQKLLNEQQKNVADRSQKLQDALAADVKAYSNQLSEAQSDLRIANDDIIHLFVDMKRKDEVKRRANGTLDRHTEQMKAVYQEAKDYDTTALQRLREPENHAEMETIFNGISDTKAHRGIFGKRKDDTAFQNMKTAVSDYLQNSDEQNAKKAYEECRNYLAGWMKPDGNLKGGSNTENTRNQGVVRMLELMENMPAFQKYVPKQTANAAADGWEILGDEENEHNSFNKLNFKTLENSLEKHAVKGKNEEIRAGRQESRKAFTNLNQKIEATRAKEQAAREKAAAKAAKGAAKLAKAAKKAKSGKAK